MCSDFISAEALVGILMSAVDDITSAQSSDVNKSDVLLRSEAKLLLQHLTRLQDYPMARTNTLVFCPIILCFIIITI